MIVHKTVTPRELNKLEEVYTEAKERCAAFWMPHTFKAGADEVSMCWQGRIDRAMGLVMQNPTNEILLKAYVELCKTAEAFKANAEKAAEWYRAECDRLSQTPKPLSGEHDCPCAYCKSFGSHIELWKAEIEYGAAIHDLVCPFERHGLPEILKNPEKGPELLEKLIESMKMYQAMCEKHQQPLDWAGVAYGWNHHGWSRDDSISQ